MRTMSLVLAFGLSWILPQHAVAADAACAPIIAATEAHLAATSWHSVSETATHFKLETIKVNGSFYSRAGQGKWTRSPLNPDNAERTVLQQLKTGELTISQCREEGSEMLEGRAIRVISYHLDVKDGPSADTRLSIGKADGLPYASSSATTSTRYTYTGVAAPIP